MSAPRYPDLDGRVALVTGGSRGLGAATARVLAANGATVVVTGRDPAALAAGVDGIAAAGGRARGIPADATDPAALAGLRAAAEEELGPVELLAAFAGGDGEHPERPLDEVTDDDWHSVIDGNLGATFFTLREFLPPMVRRGRGAIVLMSSTAARRQTPAPYAYTAAKAGVIAMTRKAAAEAGPSGVRVNCIAPSMVPTETRVVDYPPEYVEANWPLGRLGTPDDVAHATAFLLSDAAGWLTGITIDVAGGRVMP
ncbi:SDR family NAD(P)-dependent oxidoreductase [Capillimicrobium parvum]|uniref:4-formylbenzenesulfonate dehydrogenase TsaC1/TsaC2 n=1 Tax=Capillimicrobium parvum TaxID=2884022 RepID=A0A9E7BZ12_9ACTN|nr:SDR family NAD(P)-dependent oxidoreductase [Capillimicrobium parvum]UGS34831.1 4-formylbenzenesulfonate dehydrogenase TsaC1/TsaC2 [Capillimicrobium parvum]